MNKATAYALLAEELETWRRKGAVALAALAGQPACSREVHAGGELLRVEVAVSWVDATRENLKVEAVANGPSHWQMERVVERIILPVTS